MPALTDEKVAELTGLTVEQVREHKEREELMRRAGAIPLPGPAADAFAVAQDIVVGPFKVRAVCDADFEALQALEHPLASAATKEFTLRGPNAWVLCWWFTRPLDEAEGVLVKGTDEVKKAAKAEFGRLQMAALMEVQKAVIKQFEIAWSPVLEYESEDTTEGGLKKNLGSTETQPATGSAG